MGVFTLQKASNDLYYFSLRANNGQVLLTSEGYASKVGCLNGVDAVKANGSTETRYERKTSSNGKYYFILKASNGQIIGTSEMYGSEAGRDNGIASVKSNAPKASVAEE
jgi:uncharacterized protein YegP (UPF0339 family)